MKKTKGEVIFDIINGILMILFSLTIIFPFYQQIVFSVSTPADLSNIRLYLYVKRPILDAYNRIFATGVIGRAYYWTVFRTALGTILTVAVTAMMAYPLSKKYFVGRKFWIGMVVFTMFFGGGLVPTYLLIRNLHLINTIWALVLPGMCGAWNIILIRNFFLSIPKELEESATIDGANEIDIFWKIIIPLSKPIIATVTLWTMVGHWNSWFDAMIYINDPKMKVLQLVLKDVLADASSYTGKGADVVQQMNASDSNNYTPESIKAAILLVTTLPIICVYPFLQKYFVKGIMVGSVKG